MRTGVPCSPLHDCAPAPSHPGCALQSASSTPEHPLLAKDAGSRNFQSCWQSEFELALAGYNLRTCTSYIIALQFKEPSSFE